MATLFLTNFHDKTGNGFRSRELSGLPKTNASLFR